MNNNNQRLQRTHAELQELQILLEKAGQFFDTARQAASQETVAVPNAPSQDFSAPLLGGDREAVSSRLTAHLLLQHLQNHEGMRKLVARVLSSRGTQLTVVDGRATTTMPEGSCHASMSGHIVEVQRWCHDADGGHAHPERA